jgi:hypothetical protein
MPHAMRRLLRILLNAATVLSLVLCAATMAAWVRSYQTRDAIYWSHDLQLQLWIETHRGGLAAEVVTPFGGDTVIGTGWHQHAPLSYAEAGGAQGTFFNRFGFGFNVSQNGSYATRQLACPYWFIMLLTAILPAARLAARRRRARRLRMRPGLCRHCGYDCRATPDRCPECGRATGDETSR